MPISDDTRRILGLARTVYDWLGYLTDLDTARQERIAKYADTIADTLARAAQALAQLQADPSNRTARSRTVREFARISGYVETMVAVLDHQLDGRKLAGVKRRLERIGTHILPPGHTSTGDGTRLDRLAEAEGYFRALADGLRA